jgi:hypothetical protein
VATDPPETDKRRCGARNLFTFKHLTQNTCNRTAEYTCNHPKEALFSLLEEPEASVLIPDQLPEDHAYGMIRWKQAVNVFGDAGMTFGNPDYVAYA